MRKINLIVACFLGAFSVAATAQEYYDLTQYYLKNSLFDSNYHYTVSQTGNVSQEIRDIDGWTAAHTADYTIVGVYQIGTRKTYNGASIPALNVDGTADGGVLALSTGWEQSLILYQEVVLPAGTYRLVTAYYNGDASKNSGKSLLGWRPNSGTAVMSKVTNFTCGEWVTDTLEFKLTVSSGKPGKIQIGFKALAAASSNSAKIAVDYVKLLRNTPYSDNDLYVYKKNLRVTLTSANTSYGDGTGRGAAALKEAIDQATAVNESTTVTFDEVDEAYRQLSEALATYKAFATADALLKRQIEEVSAKASSVEDNAKLLQAVADAQAVYDNADATVEELTAAKEALVQALEDYNYDHPYGSIPSITSDSRYARGATMAFGRMTVSGAVKEKGFCWSESPEPTIKDSRSTKTLTGNSVEGTIYWIDGLKPATMYYMRPYAISSGYQVAYGDVIKFSTIPMGTVGLSVRDGGDQSTYDRIKQASEDAKYYWDNLTEMKDFRPSVGFVDGTPTADCSYGGWVRVGNNASYQRTGTILHEWLHGVGVIPWADTEWSRHTLRSSVTGDGYGTGDWLGDRVSAVLDFLNDTRGSRLHGDYQHMWPFGINGASEDNGEVALYIGNGLVCQALGEDGLQHTYSTFAEPYYAFIHEDGVKYYLTCEASNRGRNTSYLIPTSTGFLKWREMSDEDAVQNDSTAWYITFTPGNQYYQFRNAATGQYLSYYSSSSIRTASRTNLTASEDWQLMTGRVDVDGKRGYWIIHPDGTWVPNCLQANTNGATAAGTFNIANDAAPQRWLVKTLEAIPTGIESVAQHEQSVKTVMEHRSEGIFTLDGRQLPANSQLRPGLYIINGHKVIVK